jgi:hypothetical protein
VPSGGERGIFTPPSAPGNIFFGSIFQKDDKHPANNQQVPGVSELLQRLLKHDKRDKRKEKTSQVLVCSRLTVSCLIERSSCLIDRSLGYLMDRGDST